jgi:hypothetical protein
MNCIIPFVHALRTLYQNKGDEKGTDFTIHSLQFILNYCNHLYVILHLSRKRIFQFFL